MDHIPVRILPVEFFEPLTEKESTRSWLNRIANFENPEIIVGPICD